MSEVSEWVDLHRYTPTHTPPPIHSHDSSISLQDVYADAEKDPDRVFDNLEGNVGASLVAAMGSAGNNSVKQGMQTALRGREAESKVWQL